MYDRGWHGRHQEGDTTQGDSELIGTPVDGETDAKQAPRSGLTGLYPLGGVQVDRTGAEQ